MRALRRRAPMLMFSATLARRRTVAAREARNVAWRLAAICRALRARAASVCAVAATSFFSAITLSLSASATLSSISNRREPHGARAHGGRRRVVGDDRDDDRARLKSHRAISQLHVTRTQCKVSPSCMTSIFARARA